MVWLISHAGRRQRKWKEERSGRRQRKRERKRDPSPTHTGQQQRKREEERTGRNTWYSSRISLYIQPKREVERGFRSDSARNLDYLTRSSRKPTQTGVCLTDPAIHLPSSCSSSPDLAVPSRSCCSSSVTGRREKKRERETVLFKPSGN
jgi:hypothetical protein